MSDLSFRQLRDDEIDTGQRILADACDWLLSKGIRQWTAPVSRENFLLCHRRGQNFALSLADEPVVVVTLWHGRSPTWPEVMGDASCWWLSKLATARAYRGRGLGATAVTESLRHLETVGADAVHLDCVHGDGFLPDFYRHLGFTQLARKIVAYPKGRYDMVLMRCDLRS